MVLISLWSLHPAFGKAGVALQTVAEGFVSPLVYASLPTVDDTALVVDQVGVIYVLKPGGTRADEPFLDLRNRLVQLNSGFDERGLLGLAFHPDYQDNGRFFVYYSAPLRSSAPSDWDHTSHISEFKVSRDNPLKANPNSERVLLQVDEPQFNHDGGRMAFGPDGYLYIALGDGGQANDMGTGHPDIGNGQDITTLLGAILRIDVDSGNPYSVPSDNPFVGKEGADEIFAYGFRNPWGISFDRGGTHQMFAADVGQNAFEEVNIVTKGGNYGWRLKEGSHGFNPKNPNDPPENAPSTGLRGEPLIDPILEYKNFKAHRNAADAKGISVTGGYVYRGSAIPSLKGKYVFADWSQNWAFPMGVLFVATPPEGNGKRWNMEYLSLANHPDGKLKDYIVAFGEDREGELYVLTNHRNSVAGKDGKVYKLIPSEE